MKKKLLFSLLSLVLVLSLLQTAFATSDAISAVFIDAASNQAISEIGTSRNVKAKISFSALAEGIVNVVTAAYDENGKMLSGLSVDTVTVTSDNKDRVIHTTTPFSVSGASFIKVFTFDGSDLKPQMMPNVILNDVFVAGNGFAQKFVAAQNDTFIAVKGSSVPASEIFKVADGAAANSEFFSVSADTNDVVFAADTSDWTNATLTFNEVGAVTLTATDYDFCIPSEVSVNVIEPVERYFTKFENTKNYLYRAGNRNTVALSSLFGAYDDVSPAASDVSVEISAEKGAVSGTYTPNASDWTKGTIKFTGTGVAKVTIKDKYSKEFSLLLEVIDAKNITKAESARDYDVVLLNDISNASFVVSNGHTFHGNGFTVNLPTSHILIDGNGYTGYISIGAARDDGIANGGNLDNVKIIGPVYPEMYIYSAQAIITDSSDPNYGGGYNTRYFRNSVIVYGGNCTISNSYISGSRTALCLQAGNNVVIENTTLSGGAYANMEICAGSKVTLRDLTTVQTDVSDSYGQGKDVHGLGISVASNVVDIYIEGELNQYNWLCQADWDRILPDTYQSSFPSFFTNSKYNKYWHYLNGDSAPYVNMAFIFACNWDKSKIHDNRAAIDYETLDSTISGVAGGVYSKINTIGGNAITNSHLLAPTYVSPGFNPVAPKFIFDNSPNDDADDANNANDSYCVYNEASGTLKLGLTGSSIALDLSKVVIDKNGTALDYTKYLNGTAVSGNTVTINAADGAKQTLTFKTTTDAGYDKDGNVIPGNIEYTWTVNVEVATLSFPAPVWNMGGTYQFAAKDASCVYAYYGTSNGYGEAVPIYNGIKVTYYDKNGTKQDLDFSSITTHPTGSDNSNSNAFTYTHSDGSTLTMKFSSGWKPGATTHQFTTYDKKVYIYPQSLDNDNYIRAKTTNQNFDVKITYTFTDPNGQSVGPQTMRWYNEKSSNGSIPTVQWKTFDSTNGKQTSTCVTGDTLVTLADGSYKRIDEVTYEDKLLVRDFCNGEYAEVSSAILFDHGYGDNTVIRLTFDDSTVVKMINLHQFFDAELNRFVSIDADNVAEFVGHSFVKRDGDGYKTVKLVDFEVSEEYIEAYGIISAEHYNVLVEDMFSTDFMLKDYGLFNYFEVGKNMTFDADKLAKDVETYGLYSYEDFADYIPRELFEAFNIKYMKVAVGKGQYTFEGILGLIDESLNN